MVPEGAPERSFPEPPFPPSPENIRAQYDSGLEVPDAEGIKSGGPRAWGCSTRKWIGTEPASTAAWPWWRDRAIATGSPASAVGGPSARERPGDHQELTRTASRARRGSRWRSRDSRTGKDAFTPAAAASSTRWSSACALESRSTDYKLEYTREPRGKSPCPAKSLAKKLSASRWRRSNTAVTPSPVERRGPRRLLAPSKGASFRRVRTHKAPRPDRATHRKPRAW